METRWCSSGFSSGVCSCINLSGCFLFGGSESRLYRCGGRIHWTANVTVNHTHTNAHIYIYSHRIPQIIEGFNYSSFCPRFSFSRRVGDWPRSTVFYLSGCFNMSNASWREKTQVDDWSERGPHGSVIVTAVSLTHYFITVVVPLLHNPRVGVVICGTAVRHEWLLACSSEWWCWPTSFS